MKTHVFTFIILGVAVVGRANEISPSPLFRSPGQYAFAFAARGESGFSVPVNAKSRFAIVGTLKVAVPSKGLSLTIQLEDVKHASVGGKQDKASLDGRPALSDLPGDAGPLLAPFLLHLRSDGTASSISLAAAEPLWAVNMKRAIAVTLQMNNREMPGAFKVSEPCLHGTCVVEYSSADERTVRKSNNVPTLVPSPSHRLWISVMPDICTKDIKNPLIGNSEKWYTLDDLGMKTLESFGSIEIHYHKHILVSSVNMTLERKNASETAPPISGEFPVSSGLSFEPPSADDPTGSRAAPKGPELQEELFKALSQAADGLEQHGPRDTLLRDKLPYEIHRIMSTMTFASLKAVHDELNLGTSYHRETMKNIFLEALPQCTNPASSLLVRDLVQQGKSGEATLTMLRKMPFCVQGLGPELLGEMALLLKLGQEQPAVVRHAAVLAHSTLVFRTFISGACTEDMFEEYVQLYFSRFTESSDYADRLTWLTGLSNLQLQQVRTYLAPVIGGRLGHSQHERFLAVWATMPLAHLYPQEIHDLYWPILQNSKEGLEMRVAACTMLILAEPSSHRLLSLHWYISAQSSGHLKHFFYTTIKSLEHTTFDCYKHIAKLSSYLSRLVVSPGSRFWATGNYLVDAEDRGRDMAMASQTLTVADPNTGLPNVLYFTLLMQNAGLVVYDFGIYLKLQGVAGSFLSKLRRLSGAAVRLERLAAALRDVRASTRVPALVHVELLLRHQGKAVLAAHVNQTTFDRWTDGDLVKIVNNFLQAESHVNQQIMLYPTLLTSVLPSDLGMPVQTETMLSSLTSLRGNLTHAMVADEIARRNDVHFRTSSLAMISLATYNPVANSLHTAELAQVMDIYLPANFTIALSVPNKTFRTSWLQPHGVLGPGMTAYSAAKVLMKPDKGHTQELILKGEGKTIKQKSSSVSLVCEDSTELFEHVWQVINSHKSNAKAVPWSKPLLILLHGAALASVPAEGACSLSLAQNSEEGVPIRTDTELQLVPASTNRINFKSAFTRRKESDGEVILRINGTYLIELDDDRARVSAKYLGLLKPGTPEWKVCLELESKRTPMELRLGAVFGTNNGATSCPADTELGIYLKELKNEYRLTVSSKNVPAKISSLSSDVSTVLETFQFMGGAESSPSLKALGVVAQVLQAGQATKANETILLKKNDGSAEVLAKILTASSSWLVGPPSELKILAQLGVIRECRITPSRVVNLRGEEQALRGNRCTVLLLGDCTSSPHFAVFMLPAQKGLKLRVYTGGNYADIDTSGPEIQVSVNDELVQWKPSFKFPPGEKFYDFKISELNNSAYLDSKLGALSLRVAPGQAVLQLPATQLDRGCGKCMSDRQHFAKCHSD